MVFYLYLKISIFIFFVSIINTERTAGGSDFKAIQVQERNWQFRLSFRELKPQPSSEFRTILSIYRPGDDYGNPGVWINDGYVTVFIYYVFVTYDRNEDLCPAFKQQIKTGQLITIEVLVDDTGITVELNGVRCLMPMSKFNNRITERTAYHGLSVKACSEVVIEELDFKNL